MLKRGDWLKPTRQVQPDVPSILNPLPQGASRTRLTLAKWLVDERAPTTARVAVNRIWQAYFGIGSSSTPEDFGTAKRTAFTSGPARLARLRIDATQLRRRKGGFG